MKDFLPKGATVLALNSESGAPTHIQLIPAGEIEGRDGRSWVNDDPDTIVATFKARRIDLVIDYEHASEKGIPGPSDAAGWITDLENRDGEIWAKVAWTKAGELRVTNREYRYLSPVFYHTKNERRITRLSSAGLTHRPNLDLKAFNRETELQDEETEQAMDKAQRKALCAMLKLQEDAADQSILDAVKAQQDETAKAMNAAQEPDSEKFVPRADYDQVKGELDKAQNTIAERTAKTAEAVVDAAIKGGKIHPSSRDYHLKSCNSEEGIDAFTKMVGGLPKVDMAKDGKTDGTPDEQDKPALNAEEKRTCELLGISEDDFIKERDGK